MMVRATPLTARGTIRYHSEGTECVSERMRG